MKGIPTQQDVWKAWATLFRWNGGEARLKADYHLVKAWYPLLDGLGPETPGVNGALDLLRAPGERKTAWGYFLAVMLLVTQARGDTQGYWRVACAMLEWAKQAQRAARPRSGDALTEWIDTYFEVHPDSSSPEVLAEIFNMCGAGGTPSFDYLDRGGVTFTPADPAAAMIDIDLETLKRRIRRARTSTG